MLSLFSLSPQGVSRNLEQPETKEWLTVTKETLMSDRGSHEMDEESKKLTALLQRSLIKGAFKSELMCTWPRCCSRYDDTMPKVYDTKNVVDCLWKAYQFTDELAPYMEWMEEMRSKSTRDINTNSAAQTEEHIEKHEKCMDQVPTGV